MPAINRRRGSAAIFTRGCAGGLPFCSGGNFSTGSAIALFLPWRFPRGRLYRLAHVFLDRFQLREQAQAVGRIDAFKRGRRQFGAQASELAEQGTRGLAQIEPVDAAVAVVAAAFDPAMVAEPIDQPR